MLTTLLLFKHHKVNKHHSHQEKRPGLPVKVRREIHAEVISVGQSVLDAVLVFLLYGGYQSAGWVEDLEGDSLTGLAGAAFATHCALAAGGEYGEGFLIVLVVD